MRASIKASNPTASFGELTKLAGEGWKALGPEDRVQYEQLAAKDKERSVACRAGVG